MKAGYLLPMPPRRSRWVRWRAVIAASAGCAIGLGAFLLPRDLDMSTVQARELSKSPHPQDRINAATVLHRDVILSIETLRAIEAAGGEAAPHASNYLRKIDERRR